MNEQLAAIKTQAEGGHLDVMVIAKADVLAMLAEVERLTARAEEAEALLAGSPADTLAWALDKREQELREARCEVERLTGERDAMKQRPVSDDEYWQHKREEDSRAEAVERLWDEHWTM